MDMTSVSLLDRLRHDSDPAAWSDFIAIYEQFILRFIRRDQALANDAEDVCQEVLKKIVVHLPTFERQRAGSFRSWLRVITANEVNQYWRRRRTVPQNAGEISPLLFDSLKDPNAGMSLLWNREHRDFVLGRLLELAEPEFTASTWQAFRMRVFEGRSTDEVSQILGMSKNSVDIAKSRVLSGLRRHAAEFIDED